MKRSGIGHRTAHDNGNVEFVDEPFKVKWLARCGDVLGRYCRAADDEDIHTCVDDGAPHLLSAARRESASYRNPRITNLTQTFTKQLHLDRFRVNLLQPGRGILFIQVRNLLEEGLRILVSGPQALKIENAEAAQLAECNRRRRGSDRVHGGRQYGNVEMVGVQLPGGLHLLDIAGTARCDNSDIVEGVRSSGSFASSYLYFTHASSLRAKYGVVWDGSRRFNERAG